MEKPTLLVATNNPGKVREMSQLLADLPYRILRPADLDLELEVPETGATYAENARLKATAFAARSGLIALADDSGLEIPALDNWPGPYSARVAGPGASDAARRDVVLRRLDGHPARDRRARFVCYVVVAASTGVLAESEGVLEGKIAPSAAGSGGFGFDPIFIPEGLDQTLAMLSGEQKNRISHRARAIEALRTFLKRLATEPRALQ
jgi:XTP/dITP diphosphohydrolase